MMKKWTTLWSGPLIAFAIGAVLALAWPTPGKAETLIEALAYAYSTNPQISSSQAELRAVNEGVPQELANWRPRVSVQGNAGWREIDIDGATNGFESTQPLDLTLTIQQSLYRGGRTIAGTNRAESEILSQRNQLRAVEQDVLLRAATAYMDVWRDTAVLRLTESNEQVLQRQLQAAQDRFSVGEITRTDVAQSESRLARATADRVTAEGNLATSQAAYAEVIGMLPGQLEAFDVNFGLPGSREQSIELALEDNPLVQRAVYAEQAALYQVEETEGALLPSVSLVGRMRHAEESSGPNSVIDSAEILAQVDVPLYQQGFVSSLVRESKEVANQRRLEVETARRASEQDAVAAWEALTSSNARIVSFEAQVASTTIALEGVRQENTVGARTILDILDAEQEQLDAQVNLVVARRDQVVGAFQLLAAIGRLNASHLNLPVAIYDPQVDYEEVRGQIWGTDTAGE